MLVGIWLLGCSHVDEQVMAENCRYKIISVEKGGCSVLYSYDKKTGEHKDILRTSPYSLMYASLDYENVCSVHKDSLLCFDKVTILWDFNDTMYLAIEDSADMSNPNTHTFIFNEKSDSLIHLPPNAGLMGLTSEEGHLVMQSYEYYDLGGRFNLIDVYDYGGQKVASMSLADNI